MEYTVTTDNDAVNEHLGDDLPNVVESKTSPAWAGKIFVTSVSMLLETKEDDTEFEFLLTLTNDKGMKFGFKAEANRVQGVVKNKNGQPLL